MRGKRRITVAVCVLVVAALGYARAMADVTVLQQGVDGYAGCKDTWISNEQWERNRNQGQSGTMAAGGQRHMLIRFDLAAIAKADTVHKAVLRLSDTGFPRKGRDGKFAATLEAYALAREWSESASWGAHARKSWRDKGEPWATAGGDFAEETKAPTGPDVLVDGPWGHVHELDVTEIVRAWVAGKLANHGLLIKGVGRSRTYVASSDWGAVPGRPQLIIDHGAAAAGIPALKPPPAKLDLDPISKTPDAGKGDGDYDTICVGQNPKCVFRGKSTDAYIKENAAQFPGTWGWMNQCRVGGVAGDFNRTLLYFDLSGVPKAASIKSAKLVCSLVTQTSRNIRGYRNGVFLLKLPGSPGWSASDVTSAEIEARVPWPKGGLMACSSDKPLALGVITQKEGTRRGRKYKYDAGIEFDLTGAVRAWVQGKVPNCGVVLDNRIEGGAYDIFSSRAFRLELRPYLQLEMSPGPNMVAPPMTVKLAPPPGDYWVEPMKKVYAKFKGKKGTLAQYGDSITVSMAYLAGLSYGKTIERKNMTPEVRKEMDLVQTYSDRKLWRAWKNASHGNTGNMMSNWLFGGVDGWQKKMQPECATIMFGTNDIGRIWPPQYTEYMAASCRRMMQDGTVPMLNSIPPCARGGHREYWLAALSIAHGLKVPLIDYYAETMKRRPDDWNGRLQKFKDAGFKGYGVPTIVSGDGTHPSNPKEYQGDWSEKALSCNGFGLRDYMTLRMYYQVISKVFQAAQK